MIDVVFEKGDIVFQSNIVEDRDDQLLDGAVVCDEIEKADTLRRSILKMSHIDVEPPAVEQKPAVAGGSPQSR